MDVDILMTHTPPHSILDVTRKGKMAGCKYLDQQLKMLNACRLHTFGHIHESHGFQLRPKATRHGQDCVHVNAAMYARRADKPAQAIIVDLRN
jgi:hypothetical protein